MGNDFLPFVITTLGGVGPPAFREFLRSAHASGPDGYQKNGSQERGYARRRGVLRWAGVG